MINHKEGVNTEFRENAQEEDHFKNGNHLLGKMSYRIM